MRTVYTNPGTGLPGLDTLLAGLRPGDNVVWHVESLDDYAALVRPFCREAVRTQRPLVYFRFAAHAPLLQPDLPAEVHSVRPDDGFEPFISQVFDVIERCGIGACYVFDCLSELAVDWYSDRMLGNFFMLTCPYLYTYETLTYFALMRNRNTSTAIDAIHATAQVVIDVYRDSGRLYVHPLKVYRRHSDTMYTLHAWEEGDRFTPVWSSVTLARILTRVPRPMLGIGAGVQDTWTRTFCRAQELATGESIGTERKVAAGETTQRLLRMAITRDPRLLRLAGEYLTLDDLVSVGRRMIGTGLIGGKSAGMLIARAVLRRAVPELAERLEAHDSFYIGADVFYTYLVLNGCWWVRRRLRDPALALDSAHEARQRMLAGVFPDDIKDQFAEMLEYFGQSPIIVRSSSLLEDAYGNAFSGKYESVFCANQGTPEERLEQFMAAVRTVYASTMDREALQYRMRWGLLERDEQMALLVQRVSGQPYGRYFCPQIAGVGYSFNPFVWNTEIDPHAGFLRLVFGLGTRAVDRADDDYTRIVALNVPQLRPEGSFDEVRKYAQRRVDVLDLRTNQHASRYFEEIAREAPDLPLHLFAAQDTEAERRAADAGIPNAFAWLLTFEELLTSTGFVEDMRRILTALETAYAHPVDIEFAANFTDRNDYSINLLQCRPLQVRGRAADVRMPDELQAADTLVRTTGPIVGNSRAAEVDRLIYVVPAAYAALRQDERYAAARLIGRLTHAPCDRGAGTIMLVGPGRWGTTTPALGVPVTLADIDTVAVLCECALMHEGLVPDVSLGTHFFNDIVELDMLYMGVYPDRPGHALNRAVLESAPNSLVRIAPQDARWAPVVRVLESSALAGGRRLFLCADTLRQEAVCFLGPCAAEAPAGGGTT